MRFPPLAIGLTALTGLAALGAGCNHTPVSNLEKSFTFKVTKDTGDADPIKIDFLWVVDNSSSMCQEQVSLATNFTTFVDQIQTAFDIDPRVAVTTVDAQCDVNGTSIFSSKGKFNQHVSTTFPRACQAQQKVECYSDDDCEGIDCEEFQSCGAQGEWACHEEVSDTCAVNPNGSINTYCSRRCTNDQECKDLFKDDAYVCQKLSQNPEDWGCLRPPETEGCPDTLPPYLTGDNLDLFPCLATVGVNQEKCLKYEQQMRSALMAIDPNGKNAEQAKDFLRPDAYLVVIFVSDEEDCSVADSASIGEEFYETCGLLKTTDEGGPLVPVSHYINKFKSLKTDPGRVIVAAIAGDSRGGTEAQVTLDRDSYVASKSDPKTCYHQSYICISDSGQADYGGRFRDLTAGFGPNGSFTNICGEPDNSPNAGKPGIEVALGQIANTIVTVVNKVCLPRPVLTGLTVKRTRNGVTTELTEGVGPNTYRRIESAEECTQGTTVLPAIAFSDPPVPGESIEISYQGDPQFD